jgi:DNA-binding MarR family transcriptional regulator
VRDSADEHVAAWSTELTWMDPVQEAIMVRLTILGRHLAQSRRTALAGGGLQHWQFKVLLALRRGGPPYQASPSELAERIGLTRGALSARLRPLEQAGLITRSGEAGDRRRVRVQLTAAGDAAFERHTGTESRGEAALLATLTPADRETLADLLRKVVLRASDVPPVQQEPAGQQRGGGPGGEHAEPGPRAERQVAQSGGGLDAQARSHRAGPAQP